MAFPSDHVFPGPCWLLAGHELTAGERIAATPFDQGEDRHREIRTFTPYLASVSAFMTQDEFDRFNDWYEADIRGGVDLFDTKVMSLVGAGEQWWQARFVGPYRYEGQYRDRFIVTAELILLDGPYDAGSDSDGDARTTPSLMGRSLGDSDATATLAAGSMFGWSEGDSELWAIQTNSLQGIADGDSELTGEMLADSFMLTEDGQPMLIEDDSMLTEDGFPLLFEDGSLMGLEDNNRMLLE